MSRHRGAKHRRQYEFPSQDFKDQLGQHLAQYASGSSDWAKVKEFFVTTWASEKKSAKEG